MSRLDDTLREIVVDYLPEPGQRFRLSDENMAQIKQAFADEGYHTGTVTKYTLPELLASDSRIHTQPEVTMTGQEWYDRFVAEYHNKADWINAEPDMGDDAEHDVLLCAKLAAGLEVDDKHA